MRKMANEREAVRSRRRSQPRDLSATKTRAVKGGLLLSAGRDSEWKW